MKKISKSDKLIKYVTDRPGHDLRYAIDSRKVEKELGWKLMYNFEDGIRETINWYVNNEAWIKDIESGEYQRSYKK